jgi:hypothetical protein
MRALGQIASVILLLSLIVGRVHSGDDKDLRAVIAKAIDAEGKDMRDAKYKGLTMKGSGLYFGMGEGIPFSAEWFFSGNDKRRFNMEVKVMDQTLKMSEGISGDKGWSKFNDNLMPLPADEVAEAQAELYVSWVTTLVPLEKDAAFKLAPLGDVKVQGNAAVGIRVTRAGKRDVNLYFDKTSGLLVKQEYQVKDVKGGGNQDMNQESFMTDFKEVGGVKFPTKINILRDGKKYVEAEMSEYRPVESLEDAIFTNP